MWWYLSPSKRPLDKSPNHQGSPNRCTRGSRSKRRFKSVALKGATLSHLDAGVVLMDLRRDVRVVIIQKNAVKLVELADAEAIAEGITGVDFGVLEIKTLLQKLADQISEIEVRIHERLDGIREHLRRESNNTALTYLRSKEQFQLAKRLNTQENCFRWC